MSRKTPTPDQLEFAAEWLDHYEGGSDDKDNMAAAKAVAHWLRLQAIDKAMREAAKEAGIPVKSLRRQFLRNRGKVAS